MTLIKSVSGIRGTIGGVFRENLTPFDIVTYTACFARLLQNQYPNQNIKILIGRDARISGSMVSSLVSSTLVAMGIDVLDAGLSTTPTIEMGVVLHQCQAGIILTASHNPKQWNALKLLNNQGEFISAALGQELLQIAEKYHEISFATVENLGSISQVNDVLTHHIEEILKISLIQKDAISHKSPKILVDVINSTGALSIPPLLDALGITHYDLLYGEVNGDFQHNPEPLDEHLTEIKSKMISGGYDIGIVVDPDVDRLCFVCEDGTLFGEEYTLVAISDYVLSHHKSPVVSNLSSSFALKDIAEKYDVAFHQSAVGEVHVVSKMKDVQALIGGEGNGGVIFPELHYGRDALVGIALFLSYYSLKNESMSKLKAQLPQYYMVKSKMELNLGLDIDVKLQEIQSFFASQADIITIDGVKIAFDDRWVHLRKSNTEPIIRIYSEAKTLELAEELVEKVIKLMA
ncbi:MAG: phosphoglucosamine mutase [Chitinophagales bacterium]|jgi:phosphomannomutase|nr:phosphoglucosamine mutase [Chitinophagales bacterium]